MTTLNEYILENAARGVDSEFIKDFGETEIFFSIPSADKDLKDGPLIVTPNVHVEIKTGDTKFGRMLLFYTSPDDHRLSSRFGGMQLIRVAEMALSQSEIDGLLIHSDRDAWFVADKQALMYAVRGARSSVIK